MNDAPLFLLVMLNFERRWKAFQQRQNRSFAQKARYAKAELRALAAELETREETRRKWAALEQWSREPG